MSQLNLDQMNALMEGKLSGAEHRQVVEQILANPQDAQAFKALNSLRQSLQPEAAKQAPKRSFKWAYVVAAAAALFLVAAPQLTLERQKPQEAVNLQLASSHSMDPVHSFGIRDQVKRVNLIQQSKKWGSGVDTRHLIDLTNH